MKRSLKLITILLQGCNYHCAHCSSNSSPKRTEQVRLDGLLELLDDFSTKEITKQHLVSGGEPTLHPNLDIVLKSSQELGYKTIVVTNCSWMDTKNLKKTENYFLNTFPEGIMISSSFDLYHLKQDSHLLEKILLLKQLSAGRNQIMIDGAYNGKEEFDKIQLSLNGVIKPYLVPCKIWGEQKKFIT